MDKRQSKYRCPLGKGAKPTTANGIKEVAFPREPGDFNCLMAAVTESKTREMGRTERPVIKRDFSGINSTSGQALWLLFLKPGLYQKQTEQNYTKYRGNYISKVLPSL